MDKPFHELTYDELNHKWNQAHTNALHYSRCLELQPESDIYAEAFAKWDLEEKFLIAEIERRADWFPMPILKDAIESCVPFSFRA